MAVRNLMTEDILLDFLKNGGGLWKVSYYK
jgi:hypothetical protein